VVGVLAKQKESLNTVARLGALGLGNLAVAFDVKTGTIGARLAVGPTFGGLDTVLCGVIANAKIPNSDFTCDLLKTLLSPVLDQVGSDPTGFTPPTIKMGNSAPASSLNGLLSSLKAGNR